MLTQSLKRTFALALAGSLAFLLPACASNEANTKTTASPTASSQASETKDNQDEPKKLHIVATTGYLGDVITNIAPDAELTVLVGPGGDPHTQPLTTSDTEKINSADLVLWTSHDMEHKMMDQFDKLGDKQFPAGEAIAKDDLLPWEEDGQIEGNDPHIWNSPKNWQVVVTATAEKLAELDPASADEYKKKAEDYNAKIEAAHEAAAKKFEAIPKENRILITGHDAFNYLGATYDIEIHATDFVSSESQMSAKQLDELAALIAEHKVPVIFQDNLSNPDAIKHLKEAVKAKGWDVEISDKPLYADSLGESSPVDTYLGVFEYNADAIVEALTKKVNP